MVGYLASKNICTLEVPCNPVATLLKNVPDILVTVLPISTKDQSLHCKISLPPAVRDPTPVADKVPSGSSMYYFPKFGFTS